MKQVLPESAKRRVGNIMTKEVVRVYPDTPVSEIASIMTTHDIGGLPVVDKNDRVLGVVTELDLIVRNTHFKMPSFFVILDSIVYLEMPQHFQERLDHMLGTTAEKIMSKPAVTISPDDTIEQLSELMTKRRMNPIPVVKEKKLVGIVSRSDIVRMMARDFQDEE